MTDADKAFLIIAASLKEAGCLVSVSGGEVRVEVRDREGGLAMEWLGSREDLMFGGPASRSLTSAVASWLRLNEAYAAMGIFIGSNVREQIRVMRGLSSVLSRYGGCGSAEEILLKAEVLA